MKKVLACLLITGLAQVLLTGCLGLGEKNVGPDFVIDAARGTGIIVGSITAPYSKKPHGPCVALHNRDWVSFEQIRSCMDLNIKEETYQGNLFAIEAPAGTHSIDYWSLHNRMGHIITLQNKPPPLVFDIAPGQIIYIGNVHFHVTIYENWFGRIFAADPIVVEIRDKTRRDLMLFKKLYPGLAQQEPDVKLLPLGVWAFGETDSEAPTLPILIYD